jgi:hypothetical protein
MKLFNTILASFTASTSLLNGLITSNGQTKNKNSENQANLPTQFLDFHVTAVSIDKNIRSIFQDSKGNYWLGNQWSWRISI